VRLAHIGVIEWLTAYGYDIRRIAGLFMGVLVGGIYAARQLPVSARWVRALEHMQVARLLDPTVGQAVARASARW
jgi:NTE family protein